MIDVETEENRIWMHGEPLRERYDVIVCGAGSSGSVVARRIAENSQVSVLLLEAGGRGDQDSVTQAARWPENMGSETDWNYASEPMPQIDGRKIPMTSGKSVGGGSAINVQIWARGHQQDWDSYAVETGDDRWSYRAITETFARAEKWLGPSHTGRSPSGTAIVSQPVHPHPAAIAMRAGAASLGIPTFASSNGSMMESRSGCAISDVIITGGKRRSVFDSYVRPILGQSNLTVATGAHVRRVVFDGTTAIGVEIEFDGERRTISASERVVLATGAIRTPQLLMLSGIGPEDELSRLGIPVVQILPGVGQNLQDHTCFSSIWEGLAGYPPQDNASEAILFAASQPNVAAPDMLICQAEVPFPTSYLMDGLPQNGWTMMGGLAKPKSRGTVRLRSADPADQPICDLNVLSHEDDWRVARAVIELSRDICNSAAFDDLRVREVIPGKMHKELMTAFIRSHAGTFYHYSCTAKMGMDRMSVVDGKLNVYGTSRLMLADASVMPTIPTGNIMAPCVAIGERAAEIVMRDLQR